MRKTSIFVGILIIVAYLMLFTLLVNPIFGLLLEVISGLAVIGISILMYPFFISKNKKLAKGYIVGKFVEGGLMLAAGSMILVGNLVMYNNLYKVHVYFFAISALLFYILLNKTKLTPKYINLWGIIASILILVANIIELLNIEMTTIMLVIFYAPIILNEFYLAIYLIFKGFNKKQ
ncbi:DUF4386 domain-containing protein [Candidatus Pacearchaeota archaeon]|nr:DUF4386 domain-containing protein [Candidatus Pacearchaeota archaeon]